MHMTPVALCRECAAMHIPAAKEDPSVTPAAPVAHGQTSPDTRLIAIAVSDGASRPQMASAQVAL